MAHDTSHQIAAAAIDALRAGMRGELLESSSPTFDATRMVWHGMIDRRPVLIARCRNAADVAAAVIFARAHGLVIAIRSGGHNVAGYAVCDGGMMIDMSLMNGVRVAPALTTPSSKAARSGPMWMRPPRPFAAPRWAVSFPPPGLQV
jgi:hypothetical protein